MTHSARYIRQSQEVEDIQRKIREASVDMIDFIPDHTDSGLTVQHSTHDWDIKIEVSRKSKYDHRA